MKRIGNPKWILWITLFSLVLAACGSEPGAGSGTAAPTATEDGQTNAGNPDESGIEPAGQIAVYQWAEYIDPAIYDMFQEETGIQVVEDNFSSNEELLAKLQGGAGGYALIVPSDYMVSVMKEEGLLAELDRENIPNLANLEEKFKNVPYDPGNQYCVPYQWGVSGLGYSEGEVDEPTSWSVLFDPDPAAPYYGRMTMMDDVREGFAAALLYLGYDINTTDKTQLEEAKALLIQAKGALSGYDSDTFEDLVASGENLIAHGWNGDFMMAQEENENVAFSVPSEGSVVWVDNMCIPSNTPPEEKLAAEMFLDYILRPEVGAMITEFNFYASPNAAANELIDPEMLNDTIIYPPEDVQAKLQFILPVGEVESLYQRLWDEVKSAAVD